MKGPDGAVKNWAVEFGTPNALAGRGLKKDDLTPGSEVHIKGYASKNGGSSGYSVTLILKDGRSFQTGGARAHLPEGLIPAFCPTRTFQ